MNKVKLKDIADIVMGQSPESKNVFVEKKGMPLLNGPAEFTNRYPIPVQYTSDIKRIAKRRDILFCVRGSTTGRMNIADQDYAIGRGLAAIRHKIDANLNTYIKAVIEFNLKKLLGGTAGSVFPNLTKDDLFNLEFYGHDLATQQKIAAVLSALDDKIELNNTINAELEAMAKTLYDYWFVQFEFPNAEGKPYKSSGGKMVYNPILKREIPEGWEVKRLKEIANITMGQSPSGESYNEKEQGIIFFQGSTDFGWRFPENRIYTTEPTRFANEDDILLSVRAPIGAMNIAMNNCCIGRGLAALNSNENYNSFLIYQMSYFKKKFDYLNSVGTTFGSLTKDELYNLELAYPSKEVLKKFENIVNVFDKKIKQNAKQNQELAALRDWLLPMLMNGQVKVEDIEKEEEINMAAVSSTRFNSPRIKNSINVKFEQWLQYQGLAARGDVDKDTLLEIFNAMDDEDK